MRKINLIGKKFGRLTVIENAPNKGRFTQWKCKCDCGNIVYATTRDLQKGDTQSCGCLFREKLKIRITKHGGKNTRLYRIWCNMKSRATNHNLPCAKYYANKGVTICSEWKNSFETFRAWAVKHGYQENLTIDRIDFNGGYEPNNCRWLTNAEQQRNKSTTREENRI